MRSIKRSSMSVVVAVGIGVSASLFSQSTAPPTVFEGARLILGDGRPPLENSAFVVDGATFTQIGTRGAVTPPPGASRVDLSGKTVMPALVDAHAHLGYTDWLNPGAPERFTRETLVDHLERNAYYGVSVVMSMGVDRGTLPFEVRANPIPGAALLRTAGRGIAMPKGGPNAEARRDAPYGVTSEAEARQAVRELAAQKPDLVKIWVDDRGGTVQKLPPPIYRAIIEEAHTHGLRVVAHIFALEDAKELLRSGIDGFAHSVRDRDIDDEFLRLFKERPNVFLIPNLPDRGVSEDFTWLSGTVSAGELKRMSELQASRTPEAVQNLERMYGIQARNLAKLNAAGVRIGFGTDANGAGWNAHIELADMVAAGMTPAQAIVAATRISAGILQLSQHGTIATSQSADFVVLDGNPLDDIANSRRISRVYLRGQEVDRAALRRTWTGQVSP